MNFLKVTLPKDSKVVLLEDSEMRIAWFKKRVPNLTVFSKVEDFIHYFKQAQPHPSCDFIFLDHDLGTVETGLDAAKFMSANFGRGGKFTLVHSWNREGARQMLELLNGALSVPFGDFELEVEQ